jgi:hypothetical protein
MTNLYSRVGYGWAVELGIERRDLWVGVYWKRDQQVLHLYWCPLPCVLLHLLVLPPSELRKRGPRKERVDVGVN